MLPPETNVYLSPQISENTVGRRSAPFPVHAAHCLTFSFAGSPFRVSVRYRLQFVYQTSWKTRYCTWVTDDWHVRVRPCICCLALWGYVIVLHRLTGLWDWSRSSWNGSPQYIQLASLTYSLDFLSFNLIAETLSALHLDKYCMYAYGDTGSRADSLTPFVYKFRKGLILGKTNSDP